MRGGGAVVGGSRMGTTGCRFASVPCQGSLDPRPVTFGLCIGVGRGGGERLPAHPITFPATFTGKWSPQREQGVDHTPRAPSAPGLRSGRTGLTADGLAQGWKGRAQQLASRAPSGNPGGVQQKPARRSGSLALSPGRAQLFTKNTQDQL